MDIWVEQLIENDDEENYWELVLVCESEVIAKNWIKRQWCGDRFRVIDLKKGLTDAKEYYGG